MKKIPLESFNENKPYGSALLNTVISQEAILNGGTNNWAKKYYPKTRAENLKILDDYLTLCEENDIRPIMFRVPVTEKYMKNFNPQLLEEFDTLVEQALAKHSKARFFDGWKLRDFTYDDFYDHEHLNIYGAAKFSTYLNNFIEQLDKQGG